LTQRFTPGKWRIFFSALLMAGSLEAVAQASGIPLQSPSYHILDRLEVLTGAPSPIHPEVKYFPRSDAVHFALQFDTLANKRLSKLDRTDLQYLLNDSNEWVEDTSRHHSRSRKGLFGIFYNCPANLFEVNTPDFNLRVNPMFNFQIGRQKGDGELLFQNQRGLEVRGEVDKKLFFYTNLVESQVRYPDYVRNWVDQYQAIPGVGSFKQYNPRLPSVHNAYDFNTATAYLGFKITKHVGIQLGHGRHFIGDGYRSLLLSDAGNNYLYLKLNTRVWRFHYQNLFMELNPGGANGLTTEASIPKKYAAIHYLDFQVTRNMSIGLFESVVFNRSRQFEFQYLNPVILYRTVEGMIGSPDNELVGFTGRWNLFHRVQLYGQLLLDEFVFSQLILPARKGWWGNKYGIQAGVKYMNAFGVDHLDLQGEMNLVRPYTYSHFDSLNSYTHYNQPLAHPLWANFKEIVGIIRYQPTPKLFFTARLIHARTGDDTATQNWGTDPLLGYGSRVMDYDNVIGQGVGATIDIAGLDASWMVLHNLYVDLKLLYRKKKSDDPARSLDTRVFGFGLRMNMWNSNQDY
jgi:hypothetical protein